MKKLPIGLSDFKELIQENYYFVDKSLLIRDLLEEGAKALLIPRPRRFGKTLNMSMLHYFFEKMPESNCDLFNHLKISQYPESMVHQGQYPVIFLTFKDAKKLTWDGCLEKIKNVLSSEFRRHKYLLESSELDLQQKNSFQAIIDGSASQGVVENSLKDLTSYLCVYHGKRPIILIDEYDAPIQAGFMNGYYKEIINFMREMLSEGLKDNQSLHFAVMTGILRVAKESIFSGLNNLKICSLMNNAYSDKFGLLEDEVRDLMDHVGLVDNLDDIKTWYNGYASGDDHTVYNPWSVLNYADNDGKFAPYWINTSENAIIKELIEKGSTDLKLDIEQLLAGNAIEKYVNDNIVFQSVFSQADAVWSFLLFSGYLSFDKIYLKEELLYAELRIPNLEVKSFYKIVILEWLKNNMSMKNYLDMLNSLVSGDIQEFKNIFYDFVIKSMSAFDTGGNEPEKFYHAFVLGMLVSLSENYEVKSNKESGYGRYDVMIIPKNPSMYGVIMEFKKAGTDHIDSLEKSAEMALNQIEEKQYATELRVRGVKKIIKLGIAFHGKKVCVKEKV
ncbi:ATP-binding protein [Candidatus Babeliales bacterium]|nr:ATP-binding protein [Candidatus Babeliales bacterium]